MTSAERRRLRHTLLEWYRRNRRALPWRESTDPYRVWVSEIMLQQTRVETAIPYYHRFLDRFPSVEELAVATEDEVLALWTGLGYYRRARSLHRGARQVVERWSGQLPRTAVELMELPGIGRYTAGAIASIAFDQAAPILDGNVRRVLSRFHALGSESDLERQGRALDAIVWKLAGQWVEGPDPGDFNQAVMELGATICLPTQPRCELCPWISRCLGKASGRPEDYPVRVSRPPVSRHDVAVAWIRRGAKVLLEQPNRDNPLRGKWEVPAIVVEERDDPATALVAALKVRHGIRISTRDELGRAAHGIMNTRLRLRVHRASLVEGTVRGNPVLRWIDVSRLGEIAISGATAKVAKLGEG